MEGLQLNFNGYRRIKVVVRQKKSSIKPKERFLARFVTEIALLV
ncbi:MAG: hypothetical protein ACJAZY_001358 [Spirosomataceae bacterium]|jgi:hypothetical protein